MEREETLALPKLSRPLKEFPVARSKWAVAAFAIALSFIASLLAAGRISAAEPRQVRLFILSGQSNMARFDPDLSFTPALKKAFPDDEVIVVKSAQGGQPIRRWYKNWKAPANVKVKLRPGETANGDLYEVLMKKVHAAMDRKTIDSVIFVWMQGESDAQTGLAPVYEESLRGLIKQMRDDLKRPDLSVVVGRLSDHKNGTSGWDAVRAAQEEVAKEDRHAAWVDTDDLNGEQNALHYNRAGYIELGRRFAGKSVELLTMKRANP